VFTKRKILFFSVVALAVALGAVIAREIPKSQVMQQSMAHLSLSIQDFIREHGRLPNDLRELEHTGFVFRAERGWPEGVPKWRLVYRLDDIDVNTSLRSEELMIIDGGLVNRASGDAIYFIRPKQTWWFGELALSRTASVSIYQTLIDMEYRAAATQPIPRSSSPYHVSP